MANFEMCLPHLERWEGGYDNDPNDPGKETNHGIILMFFKKFSYIINISNPSVEDLKNLTWNQATQIYKNTFWKWMYGDKIINQKIAATFFDFYVNADELRIATGASTSTAVMLMQRVLGIKEDGVMGDQTLNAINSHDPNDLFDKYQKIRRKYYVAIAQQNHQFETFLNGWINRVNAIT